MAELAQKSGYCDTHSKEPACVKAAALVADPGAVVDESINPLQHGPAIAASALILQLQLNL
jgi:hypothetical protein